MGKLRNAGKTLVQRLVITMQLYGENGLANHAAAGAYGFLLSVAPMIFMIAFFILFVFKSSPQAITALFGSVPFLDTIINEQWLSNEILLVSIPGISGVISVFSIFWAGRILALAMQRGLKVIFPGTKNRNIVIDTLVTLAIEAAVLIFVLMYIFSSQIALRFYETLDFMPESSVFYFLTSKMGNILLPFVLLGFISFIAYRLVPVNPPRKSSAFWGAFFCAVIHGCTALVLANILNPSRYSFLYGALGNIIIILVNVYFFFMFFFLGAQLAFVRDSFEALLFSKLRQTRMKAAEQAREPRHSEAAGHGSGKVSRKIAGLAKHSDISGKLFYSTEGKLKKYLGFFKKGDIIFSQGDSGYDIYYIIDGEVGIIISGNFAGILKSGSFFGEMGYLLSETRSATIIAETDTSVLALPPPIFEEILEYDVNLDRTIIEHMSRRLKNTNEKVSSLTSGKSL